MVRDLIRYVKPETVHLFFHVKNMSYFWKDLFVKPGQSNTIFIPTVKLFQVYVKNCKILSGRLV